MAIAAKSIDDLPMCVPNWETAWPDQRNRKSRWRSNEGARGWGADTDARVAGVLVRAD